ALILELVEKDEDLPNAIALNSSMVNLTKLIGPALAGFILHKFGDVECFGLNALSFIAVIGCLLLMKLPAIKPHPKAKRNISKEFSEAFQFVKKTKTISSIILFTALTGFLVLPFTTLTPVFAKYIFNGNASTLGYIDGSIGLGA